MVLNVGPRLALALLLAVGLVSGFPLNVSHGAGEEGLAAGQRVVSAARHGIGVELQISGVRYPRNALAQVHVAVTNHTRQEVELGQFDPLAPNPTAQVLSSAGDVFPPDIPDKDSHGFVPDCQDHIHVDFGVVRLPPGATQTVTQLVVLRGRFVRATLNGPFLIGSRTINDTITTPRLRLALSAPDTPPFTLVAGSPPELDITRPGWAKGPLRYEDWYTAADSFQQFGDLWRTTAGLTLLPQCAAIIRWHVVAGWPGHSVVIATYGP